MSAAKLWRRDIKTATLKKGKGSAMDAFSLEGHLKGAALRLAEIMRQTGSGTPEDFLPQHLASGLAEFSGLLGLRPCGDSGYTLFLGGPKAFYGRLVIKYATPGSLSGSLEDPANRRALHEVKQLAAQGLAGGRRVERLAGIVLDGSYCLFVRYDGKNWIEEEPLPASRAAAERILRYLSALVAAKAVTAENLASDFGARALLCQKAVGALYGALKGASSPRIKAIFSWWAQYFLEAYGCGEGSLGPELEEIARRFGLPGANVEILPFFFAMHTYYATFLKLLAVQVASHYAYPRLGAGLAAVSRLPAKAFKAYLHQNLVEGAIFREFGLKNFLEGDFFSWYLEAWDETLESALRGLVDAIAGYSLVTLEVNAEENQDLLKKLYEDLVPQRLRHSLGEYYTPDWLAERLLGELGASVLDGGFDQKVLDPACGSGTFLVQVIRRLRRHALRNMIPEAASLEGIVKGVVGFDLNPLAVLSARTNYLFAIGDLLPYRTAEIDIPVYLADAILAGRPEPDRPAADPAHPLAVRTPGPLGTLALPKSMLATEALERLTDLLGEGLRHRFPWAQFRQRLISGFSEIKQLDEGEVALLRELYQRCLALVGEGLDGRWLASSLKNACQPLLWQGAFDYVVGNPAWVNWETLPEDYRAATKCLWEHYGLFPHGGMDTILGKGKKDLSMLLTYVAMDRYLKPQGQLGFVITQAVFKTAGAGQGFRRFVLPGGLPVRVQVVEDLSELRPFEGANNRTSLVVLQKGLPTRYPVPYNYWRKTGRRADLRPDMRLAEVLAQVQISRLIAEPVDPGDPTSAWVTGREAAVRAIKKILGRSPYHAHEGVNSGGANAVYWVEILERRPDGLVLVSNLTEGAKREVAKVTAALEPHLLYPLLRGRDVARWRAVPSAHIIMIQDPVRRRGLPEEEVRACYPRTYAYLKQFEAVLRARAAYKRYFTRPGGRGRAVETGPFYSMFDVGEYTFAPCKVVWARIATSILAAVVTTQGGKPVIPQETVTLVAPADVREAHYLCAVLNSAPFNFAAQAYSQKGGKSFGSSHLLAYLLVPQFNQDLALHLDLASLSEQAHQLVVAGDAEALARVEEEIDRLAGRLWGLSEEELEEIREALRETAQGSREDRY